MRSTQKTLMVAVALLVSAAAGLTAQSTARPASQGKGDRSNESFGVRIYPGAEERPEIARAIEAYYAPSVPKPQRLKVAVYETPAAFQEVYDFYAPGTAAGKWGWRRKKRVLEHQVQTLRFYRARLAAADGGQPKLLEAMAPLLGNPELEQDKFNEKLEDLLKANPGATIAIVEGVRRIQGDPDGGSVRVVVERPIVDLKQMKLVDATRIQLIRITER